MIYTTRIAPSPTGHMHLGTARTAYFNWLAAKGSDGQFLLRIDDTDEKRSRVEYTDEIVESLEWLGISPDFMMIQSENLYRADRLLSSGKAMEQDGAIKLEEVNLPDKWMDHVVGEIAVTKDDYENSNGMVLIRKDGSPTYHFASVMDDIRTGVNFIIRGVDHISNTARQIALFNALGAQIPKFAHIGLVIQDGRKLSKRDGSDSVLNYRDAGYSPEAVLNTLLRLGWGPRVDDKTTAIIPKEKAISMVLAEGRMKSSNSSFDPKKLDAYNRKYRNFVMEITKF